MKISCAKSRAIPAATVATISRLTEPLRGGAAWVRASGELTVEPLTSS